MKLICIQSKRIKAQILAILILSSCIITTSRTIFDEHRFLSTRFKSNIEIKRKFNRRSPGINAVKVSATKSLNKNNESRSVAEQESCILVYENINSTIFTIQCDNGTLQSILRDTKGCNLAVGKNIKILLTSNINTDPGVVLEPKTKIAFPLAGFPDHKNIKIVKLGSVIVFSGKNFSGNFEEILDKKDIDYHDKPSSIKVKPKTGKKVPKEIASASTTIKNIMSVLLGVNTALKIDDWENVVMLDSADTNITWDSAIDAQYFGSFFRKNNKLIPQLNNHCVLLFPEDILKSQVAEELESTTPETFCSDNDFVIKTGKSDAATDEITFFLAHNNSANKDAIKSAIVGEESTFVLFNKKRFRGSAVPVTKYAGAFSNTPVSGKIKSFLFVMPKCALLFTEENYSGENYHICFTIDSLSKAWWGNTTVKSIILGKNTEITVYSGENFTGEEKIVNKSIRQIKAIISDNQIGSLKFALENGKISLITSTEERKSETATNNNNCIILYAEENFLGESFLACKDYYNQPFVSYQPTEARKAESRFKAFKSIKVLSPTSEVILYYQSKSVNQQQIVISSNQAFNQTEINLYQGVHFIEEGCAIFYSKPNYKGSTFLLCHNSANLEAEYTNIIKNFRSLVVAKNTKVTLFEEVDFQNGIRTYEVSGDIAVADSVKIKSVEISMVNGVYNSQNSILNLAYGFLEGLLDDTVLGHNLVSIRTKMKSCLVEGHFEEKKISTTETLIADGAENQEGLFTRVFSKVKSFLGSIINVICYFRGILLPYAHKFISAIEFAGKAMFTPHDHERERIPKEEHHSLCDSHSEAHEEEAKAHHRKLLIEDLVRRKGRKNKLSESTDLKQRKEANNSPYRRKLRGFYSFVKSAFKFVYCGISYLWDKAVSLYNKIYTGLIDVFKWIYAKIGTFMAWVVDFPLDKKRLTEMVDCAVDGMLLVKMQVTKTISRINILSMAFGMALTPWGLAILIDFVLANICEYKSYAKVISLLKDGILWLKNKKDSTRSAGYTLLGNAFGTALRTFNNATPILGEFYHLFSHGHTSETHEEHSKEHHGSGDGGHESHSSAAHGESNSKLETALDITQKNIEAPEIKELDKVYKKIAKNRKIHKLVK